MIWLASYPRSGNTFLRIVLYEVYGIESSTFHNIPNHPFEENYIEYPLVKTHLQPHQLIPNDPGIPAIYLVRDGRDSLVSMAYQRKNLIDTGTQYVDNLKEAIIAAEGSYFGGWGQNVLEWLERASMVIRFEDLIVDPIACIEQIRPWIDLPDPRLDNLPSFEELKTKKMKYGSGMEKGYSPQELAKRRKLFFRRGKVGGWKEEMPGDLHELFWVHHGEAMRKVGYTDGEIKSTLGQNFRLDKIMTRLKKARNFFSQKLRLL